MEKRKTNRKGFLALLLLLLVGVTSYYVSGTYAKYVGQVEGQGSATVAKWAFEAEHEDVDFTVNLAKTYDASTLVGGKIAPGTQGSFDIELTNTQSEVGYNYVITLGDVDKVPTNLVFTDAEGNTLTPGTGTIEGTIAVGGSKTVTVSWAWAYETENGDDEDTADGIAAETLTIPVTINATQVTPQ